LQKKHSLLSIKDCRRIRWIPLWRVAIF